VIAGILQVLIAGLCLSYANLCCIVLPTATGQALEVMLGRWHISLLAYGLLVAM
jgi:hypothetical protein